MALISVSSKTTRMSQQKAEADANEQAITHALLSALDAKGASVSDKLPLDVAERSLGSKAAEQRSGSFMQAPFGTASYNARSGVIFGILNQMKEEFESTLSTSQKDEMKSAEDYKALAEAKTAEIAASKEKLDTMEGEFFATKKALVDAKEDLELTRAQVKADKEFLQNLRLTCQDLDKQWEWRSKTRAEELKAITETIAIVTDDDNMDMLRKTVTLLQEDMSVEAALRRKVVSSLRRAASDPAFDADDLLTAWHSRPNMSQKKVAGFMAMGSPRSQLSTLAVSAQLDAFTKVKEAMDQMVAELKKEQEEEVEFKQYCNTELDKNAKITYRKTEDKEDLEAKIAELAALIKKLAEEIADCQDQVAETKLQTTKASQAREAENAEFQTSISDARATQEILNKALDRLKLFYNNKNKVPGALLQKKQTPPVKFNSYKKNAGASPVIGLIEQIIEDSKAEEKEAIAAEAEATKNYEAFVKDSNALVASLTDAIAAKTKSTEQANLDTETANTDLASTNSELESLAQSKADLHNECDFVLKNFEIRQTARLQEIEAIGEAKAIISGMK